MIGSALCFALARKGASVTLLERAEIGSQASATAAGMLAPLAESEPDDPIRVAGLASTALLAELVPELRELAGVDPRRERSGILQLALPGERVGTALPARILRGGQLQELSVTIGLHP